MISRILKSSITRNNNKIIKFGYSNVRQFTNTIIPSTTTTKSIISNNNKSHDINNIFDNNKIRFYSTTTENNEESFYIIPSSNKEYDELLKDAIDNTNKSSYLEAIDKLNKAITISSSDPKAYSLRADIFELLGRFDEAIQDYNKVLLFIPESIPCYSSLAACYSSKGDTNRAIKYFEQILTIDPNYIPANGYLGDIYLSQNNLVKSLEYYKKVLSLEPNSAIGLLGLGHLAVKQGNVSDANRIYNQIVKLGAGKPIESFHTQVSLTTDGPKITRSIEENPIYTACLCLAHNYYLEGGDKDGESLKYFTKVIEYNPKNASAYAMMSIVKLRQQDPESALVYIKKSVDLEPSDFNHAILADTLFDLERYEEAVPMFKLLLANYLQGESPEPEKAVSRLNILHNLILSFAHLSSQFPNVINYESIRSQMTPTELTTLSKLPDTLFELNATCRHWAKFFERLSSSVYQNGTVQKEFTDLMLDFIQAIALASGETIQMNHRDMQNQSEGQVKINNDSSFDELLFGYYEEIVGSIFNNNNNNNKSDQ